MRQASQQYDEYAKNQEGVCWANMRIIMKKLKPAFVLAVGADPSLALAYPSLAALLTAKEAIAKKAVATKRLKQAALAAGKPAIHGAIGRLGRRRPARSSWPKRTPRPQRPLGERRNR